MIFYKIRSKSTGKFRMKGGEPHWNKTGKTFETLGRLRQMITHCMSYNDRRYGQQNDFGDWEIIEYEVIEKDVKGVHEIIKPEKIMELLKK